MTTTGRLIDLFLVVLIGLGAGYTGPAVADTPVMATAARRAEFRSLRLAGACALVAVVATTTPILRRR